MPIVSSGLTLRNCAPFVRAGEQWCRDGDLALMNVLLDLFTALGGELSALECTSPYLNMFKDNCKLLALWSEY
jgi:hypothetical protein